MRKPLFNIGEKVLYKRLDKKAIITESFTSVPGQWRYYIQLGGVILSVPETAIFALSNYN